MMAHVSKDKFTPGVLESSNGPKFIRTSFQANTITRLLVPLIPYKRELRLASISQRMPRFNVSKDGVGFADKADVPVWRIRRSRQFPPPSQSLASMRRILSARQHVRSSSQE
jgi:hypothetical protein